nr:YhcU family protein [uncultured Bacillus sp.]
MKVVFAPTTGQEEKIKELINHFYTDIFPAYFSDGDIQKYERLKVLGMSKSHFEQFGTLKDAYQVIASLQTLIAILETENLDGQYMDTFYKNVAILEEYGLYFPFGYEQFEASKSEKEDEFSIYIKPANQILI